MRPEDLAVPASPHVLEKMRPRPARPVRLKAIDQRPEAGDIERLFANLRMLRDQKKEVTHKDADILLP